VSYEEEEAHQQQQQQQQARQKETQNINKSLSCLGDVVMALSNTPLSRSLARSLSLSSLFFSPQSLSLSLFLAGGVCACYALICYKY
jgi:hypothetical protein